MNKEKNGGTTRERRDFVRELFKTDPELSVTQAVIQTRRKFGRGIDPSSAAGVRVEVMEAIKQLPPIDGPRPPLLPVAVINQRFADMLREISSGFGKRCKIGITVEPETVTAEIESSIFNTTLTIQRELKE